MSMTNEKLIQQAQHAEPGLIGSWLPMISNHYVHFAEDFEIDINTPKLLTLEHFIKYATYAEKRDIFESIGFKVHYMTLSVTKALHHIRDNQLEQAFINKSRNIFLYHVTNGGLKDITFILEYTDQQNPLADYTVDWKLYQQKQEQKKRSQQLFKNLIKNK